MKGYKSVGVTKHKAPNNRRDQVRQQQFRQKHRSAGLQQNRLSRQPQGKEAALCLTLPLTQTQEVAL